MLDGLAEAQFPQGGRLGVAQRGDVEECAGQLIEELGLRISADLGAAQQGAARAIGKQTAELVFEGGAGFPGLAEKFAEGPTVTGSDDVKQVVQRWWGGILVESEKSPGLVCPVHLVAGDVPSKASGAGQGLHLGKGELLALILFSELVFRGNVQTERGHFFNLSCVIEYGRIPPPQPKNLTSGRKSAVGHGVGRMSRRQLAQGVDHLGAIGGRDEVQVAGADELLPCFAKEAAIGMVDFQQPPISGA